MYAKEPTIANLPEDPYADPSPPSPTPADNVLNMAAYSDKSFVVFGEGTKIHKASLGKNGLGGKFIPSLKERPGFPGGPGWIFYLKLKDKVKAFVDQVNSGAVPTQNQPPSQGTVTHLPSVVIPVKNRTYQTVKWRVFRPAEGMKVTIKVGGSKMEGEVLQTDMTGDVVDTAYITANGITSKVVICSGKWQVWGYQADHTVYFSPNGAGSPPDSPPDEEYDDIAHV